MPSAPAHGIAAARPYHSSTTSAPAPCTALRSWRSFPSPALAPFHYGTSWHAAAPMSTAVPTPYVCPHHLSVTCSPASSLAWLPLASVSHSLHPPPGPTSIPAATANALFSTRCNPHPYAALAGAVRLLGRTRRGVFRCTPAPFPLHPCPLHGSCTSCLHPSRWRRRHKPHTSAPTDDCLAPHPAAIATHLASMSCTRAPSTAPPTTEPHLQGSSSCPLKATRTHAGKKHAELLKPARPGPRTPCMHALQYMHQ